MRDPSDSGPGETAPPDNGRSDKTPTKVACIGGGPVGLLSLLLALKTGSANDHPRSLAGLSQGLGCEGFDLPGPLHRGRWSRREV